MPWSTFGWDGQRKYLTRSEADRFLASARNHDLSVYVFCWFIAATGCRISEALMITAKCIDLEANVVIVESLKKRRKFVYRAIPLPVRLLDSLTELVASGNLAEDSRLWPWSRMTGYRRITQVMREAGIEGAWATPKGLRHGFGVRAVQSGVPLHLVQRWLGHADMKTTAIYASAVGPEERQIASRTWLEEDGEAEDTALATRENHIGESVEQHRHALQGGGTVLPDKNARKPWLRRLMPGSKGIFSCYLIQFYLFCHSFLP